MNPGSKRELTIETPLAVLLTLAPWGYDQLGLPHSKAIGYLGWGICVALLLRILWISWRTLVSAADITFKEASALGCWRRQVIRYDIAGMHTYFAKLGIPVPDKIPPLTVHEGGQAIFTPPHLYRGALQIPRVEVKDRKVVTHIYAVYLMQKAFPDPTASPDFWNNPADNFLHLSMITNISVELREYFHASYWGVMKSESPGALMFWKIRESLGRRLTDKLISRVYRVAVDSFAEISDPDIKLMYEKALKIADCEVEAYQQSWPKIQQIIDRYRMSAEFIYVPNPGPS